MYVDILYQPHQEIIKVVERNARGERVFLEYAPDYHFFISDMRGVVKSMYGNTVKKIQPSSYNDLRKQKNVFANKETWEIDAKQDYRCLEKNYLGVEPPKLHVAFFDIETDFDQDKGYSEPSDAFNPVISVSIYLQWLEQMICIAVPPKTLSWDEAEAIASEVPNTMLVETEREMLDLFLTLIEDADILSGWNSEFYDIPYTMNRVAKILGKQHMKRFCLWDVSPELKMVERFGKEEQTYNLYGRVHLDYLKLYKNFNFEEKKSYKLNSIAEAELNENKVEYEGSLDDLYNKDFKLFLEYNIKDTKLLDSLDKKLQYIDLANDMAHDNCIKIPAVMGAVGMTEQAIIIEAHNKGVVVKNKTPPDDEAHIKHKAAGGWVSQPKVGLHDWVGSADLNSLYPSVIRALNASNETIFAQIRSTETIKQISEYIGSFKSASKKKAAFAEWWNDRFCTLEMQYFHDNDNEHLLTLDLESGESFQLTGAQIREMVFDKDNNLCISANGTIFRTDIEGIIPSLLARWYNERKVLKKTMNMYGQLEINEKNEYPIMAPPHLCVVEELNYDSVELSGPFSLDTAFNSNTFKKLVESDNKEDVLQYMNAHRLTVHNGVVVHSDQEFTKEIVKFWDKKQHVKKILLNSLYGGLLSKHHRFFDQRLGQSTTLTGRQITRHMTAKANEILTGNYDYEGACAIYNDTDSCSFDTVIDTSRGSMTIEDAFNMCELTTEEGNTGKEYAVDDDLMVLSYDKELDSPYLGHINYIYRHKVDKPIYEIEDENGNIVKVTEDHSVMIERDGELFEVKPLDINEGDIIIKSV